MATTQRTPQKKTTRRAPATTPEARENQIVALAVDEVEKQIREGRASSQVLTHYLKLGSTREQLEQEKLRGENAMLRAKIENLESAKRVEELYEDALNAMRSYAGDETTEDVMG
jgi:hypothetical protein